LLGKRYVYLSTYQEERLDKHGSRLYTLRNLNIPQKVSKVVDDIITDAVDWAMQAPLRARLSDLPAIDMKEILQQRMFEDNSYEAHDDHKNLYEALQKSYILTDMILRHIEEKSKNTCGFLVSSESKPFQDTGFEFKHDYTIIESPRAVVFLVNNNKQKIIRFNEMYKFNDALELMLLKTARKYAKGLLLVVEELVLLVYIDAIRRKR
nr:hypothetical protein [Tanacetum cinerariifolium]